MFTLSGICRLRRRKGCGQTAAAQSWRPSSPSRSSLSPAPPSTEVSPVPPRPLLPGELPRRLRRKNVLPRPPQSPLHLLPAAPQHKSLTVLRCGMSQCRAVAAVLGRGRVRGDRQLLRYSGGDQRAGRHLRADQPLPQVEFLAGPRSQQQD